MQIKTLVYTLAFTLLTGCLYAQAAPEEIPWETNLDDPPIGSPDAIKGGTYRDFMLGYPKTFRLFGPNSNEAFANWTRPTSIDIGLVLRHPTTDNHIPALATHWHVANDHKTVYFKLDPDARWSDGEPITADDYLYAKDFLSSPLIRSPYHNQYMEDYIDDVVKLDDYTIKIVGKKSSWRALDDYSMSPVPEHATNLTETWVDDFNYTPPVVQGPYTITDWKVGESVTFTRNPDWWGYKRHYFQGMFNVDKIEIIVITDIDRAFDYFKKGRIDTYTVGKASMWAAQMDFPELKKGWVHRKMIYHDQPEGMYGIALNLQKPALQNKDFRKAIQYLFNFDEINKKLMYNSYFRAVSAFEGTPYENEELEPYGFNPKEAGKHLHAAGFTKRGKDGILVNEGGQQASFTLAYPSKSLEPHLTVIQQHYKRAGVDMKLQLLERVAHFEKLLEKAYEAALVSMTGGFYPNPHQYFASEFASEPQTNNFWGYSSEKADELINTYRFNMNPQARLDAMHELDSLIQDEAFYVPFWSAPYTRIAFWDYVEYPEFYIPRRANSPMEFQVFWINPEKKTKLEEAMSTGKSYSEDMEIEVDPYGVKARLEAVSDAVENPVTE